MNAAALIEQARAEGVTLAMDPAGKLKASGRQEDVSRWLPAIRERKSELASLLAEPRRVWEIVEPDGSAWLSSFAPAQTLGEVLVGYPPGTRAVPCETARAGPAPQGAYRPRRAGNAPSARPRRPAGHRDLRYLPALRPGPGRRRDRTRAVRYQRPREPPTTGFMAPLNAPMHRPHSWGYQ